MMPRPTTRNNRRFTPLRLRSSTGRLINDTPPTVRKCVPK
jgi:hypothetical protein